MQNKPRFLAASMLAPLFTLLLPVIGAVYTMRCEPSVNLDGTYDDAPIRAATIFLMMTPVFYVILAVLSYFVSRVLVSYNLLYKKTLFYLTLGLGFLVGAFFAAINQFDLKDAGISFTIFFALTFVCLGLGSIAWWGAAFLGKERDDK